MNTVDQANHFASLTDHEWQITVSRWSRGSDWCVEQVQDWFEVSGAFGTWPRYVSADAALNELDDVLLAEVRRRTRARVA